MKAKKIGLSEGAIKELTPLIHQMVKQIQEQKVNEDYIEDQLRPIIAELKKSGYPGQVKVKGGGKESKWIDMTVSQIEKLIWMF